MKFDKIFLTICLIVCIFSIASVCAGDINDMAIASGDMSQVDSSQSEKIADDNLQAVEEQVNDEMLNIILMLLLWIPIKVPTLICSQ